tara:strand:- start:6196 stop:8370 length:2175 start_codon:yes stop_codon:yes gene_type:complete
MATIDENAKAAGEFRDNLNEAANAQDKIKSNLSEILFEQRNLADEARGFAKAVFDSSTQATATSAAFRGIASISSTINSKIEDIVTGEKTLNDLQKDRKKLREKELNLGIELEQALGKTGYTEEEILKVKRGQLGVMDLIDQSSNSINDEAFDLLNLYDDQLNALRDQKKEYDQIEDFAKKIDENMGVAGTATEGLSGVLEKLGAGSFGKKLGLEEALSNGRKEAARLAGTAGDGMTPFTKKLGVAGKMIGTMGKAFVKALGPIAIIAELVKGIMAADEQTKELGRSMMMTKNESAKFSGEIANATRSNYQMGITGTKVLENITKVNKQFGFISEFSGETLVSMTKLTYTLKIGEEAAGNLAAAAEATGVNFEDNYKNILASSYELQQQAGTQVDLRAVLEDTGKVTGQIRANFGGNTIEIAKAVTNARLLGTEMGTIAAAGKQLLDFESSISKELEAELLTGRNLNLERARAAALTGDQVTLQNELAREMGSFSDFSKLNVIQQEALAGAMGMSVDSMSDMLFNQETMNKSAKELRALGKDELANRLEQKTAQDKMNAAMTELKEVFIQLGTALSPILSLVSLIAGAISTVVGFSMDLLNILNPFNNAFSADYESQGIAAGKNLIGIEDGVIGPGGDLITTSPEDFLIATKDPGEMLNNIIIPEDNNKIPTSNTPIQVVQPQNVDTSKMEKLLESIVNKPAPKVQMDSIEVGTVAGMSAFSIQ